MAEERFIGGRSELFTTQVTLDKRTYFFNVKENRGKDVFLQIVESKKTPEGEQRLQIAIFEDDMQKFLQGLDEALNYINKSRKERIKIKAAKSALLSQKRARMALNQRSNESDKPFKPSKNIIKKTGRTHIVSKIPQKEDINKTENEEKKTDNENL